MTVIMFSFNILSCFLSEIMLLILVVINLYKNQPKFYLYVQKTNVFFCIKYGINYLTFFQSLAVLNASLCYLNMKFLSSDDSYDAEDAELIKRYLKRFFLQEKTFSSAIKCQCIPYFLKMIQLCKYKNDVPEGISFNFYLKF